MCVKFILICHLQKKLLRIFATKVGYVLMAMYVGSLNVFCQGSDISWGNQSLGSGPQNHYLSETNIIYNELKNRCEIN